MNKKILKIIKILFLFFTSFIRYFEYALAIGWFSMGLLDITIFAVKLSFIIWFVFFNFSKIHDASLL